MYYILGKKRETTEMATIVLENNLSGDVICGALV